LDLSPPQSLRRRNFLNLFVHFRTLAADRDQPIAVLACKSRAVGHQCRDKDRRRSLCTRRKLRFACFVVGPVITSWLAFPESANQLNLFLPFRDVEPVVPMLGPSTLWVLQPQSTSDIKPWHRDCSIRFAQEKSCLA